MGSANKTAICVGVYSPNYCPALGNAGPRCSLLVPYGKDERPIANE